MSYNGYNMGPSFDQGRPFDQTWNSVPVPGISSGMLASGMNFDYLPPQTPLVIFQPPPSPLQQHVGIGGNTPGSPFPIGSPVRIVHMVGGPDSSVYNGLIGDVVAVDYIDKSDGMQEMVFDVRCPLDERGTWVQSMIPEMQGHAKIQPSQMAMQAARLNVKTLGPDHGLYRENGGGPPPYVLLRKFPSEKLEPFGPGSESHGIRRVGPPGVEMMPVMAMPGVMGSPTQPVPPGARAIPMDPTAMGMGSMRGGFGPQGMGPGGMPPSQPWGMGPPGSMGGAGMGPPGFMGPMGPPGMGPMGPGMMGPPGSMAGMPPGMMTPPMAPASFR